MRAGYSSPFSALRDDVRPAGATVDVTALMGISKWSRLLSWYRRQGPLARTMGVPSQIIYFSRCIALMIDAQIRFNLQMAVIQLVS